MKSSHEMGSWFLTVISAPSVWTRAMSTHESAKKSMLEHFHFENALLTRKRQPPQRGVHSDENRVFRLNATFDFHKKSKGLCSNGFEAHIRSRGEEIQEHGRYPARRWIVERTFAWLKVFRSLRTRYCVISAILWACFIFSGLYSCKKAYVSKLYAGHSLIRELELGKNIHHLGYVSDNETRWLYEHARCMIMPSFFGPTNIPHNVTDISDVIKRLWTDDNLCQEIMKHGYAQASAWTQADFEARFLDIMHHVENS